MMSQKKRRGLVTLTAVVALGLLIQTAYGVNDIRYSYYGGGQQIWIPAARTAAVSANYGQAANFVEDSAANDPISGHAYYFPPTGLPADAWRVFCPDPPVTCTEDQAQADAWVQYEILPADLPGDISLSGKWYFWTRTQQLYSDSDVEYNQDSDWLVVNGNPPGFSGTSDKGDIDITDHVPTDAEWYTAVTKGAVNEPQREYDRICNDIQHVEWPPGSPKQDGRRPNWVWLGNVLHTGNYRLNKNFKLINDRITFRIYEAAASPWNGCIDVICWSTIESYIPPDQDFNQALILGQCTAQHTSVSSDPASHDNASNTTITITGTDLHLVNSVKLVPPGGGTELVGINLVAGAGNTTLTAEFPTQDAQWGTYDVVTLQPNCATKTLPGAFQLTCATATVFSSIEPGTVSNPQYPLQFTVKGANVTLLTSVALVYANEDDPNNPHIVGTNLVPSGNDLIATFDLSCFSVEGGPAGPYHLEGTRNPDCSNPARLSNALWVVKPPTGFACVWQPWAAPWSELNRGPDLDPDPVGEAYNPTNWDYSFSQDTNLGLVKDTPDSSSTAFHFFWDSQPPETGTRAGSGGIYQEISVTPGVPIEYSFWWKGQATYQTNDNVWYELLLLDGPFNLYYADGYQEQTRQQNNPYMVRKKIGTDGNPFAWEQITDQTPADQGTYGPRPQTITPVNDVVTVVFKAGRVPSGRLEFLIDKIEVRQGGGSNLIANGDFESGTQVYSCENEWVFKDSCEADYWRWSPLTPPGCPNPFADYDADADVDQADFARFQLCYTGPTQPIVANECRCFDSNNDNYIDQIDAFAFEVCASGPGVAADPTCDD